MGVAFKQLLCNNLPGIISIKYLEGQAFKVLVKVK